MSYESKVLETHITIGVVVRGEADLSKKFKTQHAIHVTFIWPVNESGRRVRQTETRFFLWNDEYGWFNAIVGRHRGVAVMDVCSEKLGMIEIKEGPRGRNAGALGESIGFRGPPPEGWVSLRLAGHFDGVVGTSVGRRWLNEALFGLADHRDSADRRRPTPSQAEKWLAPPRIRF